jgi:DNA adenine methylase
VTGLPPPTNYYGGKARLAPWIASLLPVHRTYVEPFAGSAAVLFAKRPSPTEILNDLDGQVVNFFQVLHERPADLARALALTPYARAEYQQLAAGFEDPGLDELERARRWFVRVNQSISHLAGRGRPSGWAAAYNTNGADHAHKFAALTNRLQELYAGWWRLERTMQRPTSNVSGGRGAVATEVIWSNRPLAHQARLLDPEGVILP